jgi:hypothetical protein
MAGEAPAIQQLRTDVNTSWPKRNKEWDGTWGDERHKKKGKRSDHNSGDAIDVDITAPGFTGPQGDALAAYAIRDPRVKYVIWNRRIYNPSMPGWRPYSDWKKHPHDHHVHVSVSEAARADTAPFAWTLQGPPPPIDLPGETKFEDNDPQAIEAAAMAKAKAEAAAKKAAEAEAAAKKKADAAAKKARKKVSEADITGPRHIYDGESSVLLGTKQRMAAHVESPHTGGGKVAKGSVTVFVGPNQLAFARKGDPTTDNLNVKTGHEAILVG